MRALSAVVACVATFAIISCSDDSAEPDGNGRLPSSLYSGTFAVDDSLESNDCAVPAPLGAIVTITIEGDSICFAGIWGGWDSEKLTGSGTSAETTVPVSPPECYAYYTISFDITYTDKDHFHGTYGSSYRKDPGCVNPDPCSFLYLISGTR